MVAVSPELLSCLVKVVGPGVAGTGFFVTSDLVLTCAHVTQSAMGRKVAIEYGGQVFAGTVVGQAPEGPCSEEFAPYPDLAVVRIVGAPAHPCVILEPARPLVGTTLYTVGFTNTLPAGDGLEPATFTYVGLHRVDGGDFLKLSTGEAVAGMSGGPLFDLERGTVCGVIKTSRALDTDRGGWGVSVAAASSIYPELLEENHAWHSGTPEVHELLRSHAESLKSLVPQQYPTHLDTLTLASDMTLSAVEDLSSLTNSHDIGLYSSYRGYGGEIHNAFDALQWARNLSVVLGDPGGGKTTILAGYCAYALLHEARLAFFVRIPDLALAAARTHTADSSAALDLVVREWARQFDITMTPATYALLRRQILRAGTTTVALDGLDEVREPSLNLALSRLIYQLAESPAKVVIASRVTGYTPPPGTSNTFFVNPFPNGGAEAFATKWFGGTTDTESIHLDRALRAIGDRRLADACRTPVVAGLVCIVAATEEIRESVSGLYHQYVNLHLTRAWKSANLRRHAAVDIGYAAKAAQDVAWAMATAPLPDGGTSWLDHVSLAWLIDVAELDPRVADLYETDGLLVAFGTAPPNDPLAQEVRWLHRTIHEHLLGSRLRAWLERGTASAFTFLRDTFASGRWAVPHEHMANQLGDSPVTRSIIDRLVDEAAHHDTPSQLLAASALTISVNSRSPHRFTQLVEYAFRSDNWSAIRSFVDAGWLTAQAVIERLEDPARPLSEFSWTIERIVSQHIPPGQQKIDLARRLRDRAEIPHGQWREFLSHCVAEVDIVQAIDSALDALINEGEYTWSVWRGAPDEVGDNISAALWRLVHDDKRTFEDVLRGVGETENDHLISRIRFETATRTESCPMFVALLDLYAVGCQLGQELSALSDEQVSQSLHREWGPQIGFRLGYFVGFGGRGGAQKLSGWTAAGYAAGAAEARRTDSSLDPPPNVVAAFNTFSQSRLPDDAGQALELWRSFEWLRTGRASEAEILALYVFYTSEGFAQLNTNSWHMPWLDASYMQYVRDGADGRLVMALARKQFAQCNAGVSALEKHEICSMFSDGLRIYQQQSGAELSEPAVQRVYSDGVLEFVAMLADTPQDVDVARVDLEFHRSLPPADTLKLVERVCERLPQIVNARNEEQLAQLMEMNLLMSTRPAKVFELLLRSGARLNEEGH